MNNSTTLNETYASRADEIFQNHILPDYFQVCQKNIWRSAWAFDSLIDYFKLTTVNADLQEQFAKRVFTDLFPASGGDWWDDFGWAGIASLRAQSILNLTLPTKINFIRMALNCWAYMYGPGWQLNSPGKPYEVPYPNQNGWKEFIQNKGGDVGAPNVYNYWAQNSGMFPGYQYYAPMFTPGGIWNSPHAPESSSLDPLQNTVTNSLFTLLSLRVYELSQNPDYASFFTGVNFDTAAIRNSWINQLNWFAKWFAFDKNGNNSLLYDLSPGAISSWLIRERVSTFAGGGTDMNFHHSLAWTGDQGIMLAVFRETASAIRKMDNEIVIGNGNNYDLMYKAVIDGVSETCWGSYGYTGINSPVLRPWVQYYGGSLANYNAFPPGDDEDYSTGTAVFCRYLQQAVEAGYSVSAALKTNITNLANEIVADNSFERSNSDCDAFWIENYHFSSGANLVTPWINRLAVLSLAAKLNA